MFETGDVFVAAVLPGSPNICRDVVPYNCIYKLVMHISQKQSPAKKLILFYRSTDSASGFWLTFMDELKAKEFLDRERTVTDRFVKLFPTSFWKGQKKKNTV